MQSLSLPEPALEEMEISQQLQRLICHEIEHQGGAIPFDHYMELALYAPGLGYYTAGMRKFGAQGDFVTAPEISPLFSRSIAHQVKQLLDLSGGGDVLEFGAGSGRLAVDLLQELELLDALPERYLILELSPDLQQRQQQLVAAEIPRLKERVQWLERLPQQRLRGAVVANEVLDAMPVHRFRVSSGGYGQVEEEVVACMAGELATGWRPASAELQRQIRELGGDLPDLEVPRYPAESLTNNELGDDKLARQAFGRGLCLFGDNIVIAGSSPSTITAWDMNAMVPLKSINLTMDVRNAIHGLEVWKPAG